MVQCGAVWCSVLQCVANVQCVLQGVANVQCVLQCVANVASSFLSSKLTFVCVAVCYRVLQYAFFHENSHLEIADQGENSHEADD